jgi:hypothetical protein
MDNAEDMATTNLPPLAPALPAEVAPSTLHASSPALAPASIDPTARSGSVTSSLSTTHSIPAPVTGYSPATEQVLARLSREVPTFDRVKSQLMTSVITTSANLPSLPPSALTGRGRGRPRGSGKRRTLSPNSTPRSSITPTARRGRGRGSGRGRGRGGGRGTKRKRDSDDDDISDEVFSGDESAQEGADPATGSEDNTPLQLKTKSGRAVNRPAPFVPTTSPTTQYKKKRKAYHRNPENAVCKVCERGHSPINNVVVFCDGCAAPYHQFCHNPPIAKEVVEVAEMAWYCSACQRGREIPEAGGVFVRGQGMTDEQASLLLLIGSKRRGLSNLLPFRNAPLSVHFHTTR